MPALRSSHAGPAGPGTLSRLIARIEPVFEQTGTDLFARLDEARDASRTLSFLSSLTERARRTRLEDLADAVDAEIGESEARFAYLAEVSQTLRQQANRLSALLAEQDQDQLMTSMVANSARVVASSMENADTALENFANDVRAVLEDAKNSLLTLHGDFDRANSKLKEVETRVHAITGHAEDLRAMRAEFARLLHSLSGHDQLDLAARGARGDLEKLSRVLERLVGHLQVGDATRQRLEHVQQIRNRARGLPRPQARVMQALARAQYEGSLADLDAAIGLALPEIEQASRAWASSLEAMQGLAGAEIANGLRALSDLLARYTAGLNALDALHEAVTPEIAIVSRYYDASAKSAEQLSTLEDRIKLLGINAILCSSRGGSDGAAMREVARQLSACTQQISARTHEIVELARLQEVNAGLFESIRTRAPADEAAKVSQTIASLEGEVGELNHALGQMAALCDTARARGDIAPVRGLVEDFARAAHAAAPPGALDVAPADAAGMTEILQEIRALYTMQAERQVHDSLLGACAPAETDAPDPGAPALSPPAIGAAAPIDDIFF